MQYDYNAMVAQKRNSEANWRQQTMDDPEIAARIRSAEAHLHNVPQTIPSYGQQTNNAQFMQQQRPQASFAQPGQRDGRRQQQATYMQELQQQAQEQRLRREREKRDMAADDSNLPPWLRGNAQPKDGMRGRSNPTDFAAQQTFAMRRDRSMPDINNYGAAAGTKAYTPSSVDPDGLAQSWKRQQAEKYRQELAEQMQQAQQKKLRERQEEKRQPSEVYDPFGKGGGGAPTRTTSGRIVADYRKLRGTWNGTKVDQMMPRQVQGPPDMYGYQQQQQQSQPMAMGSYAPTGLDYSYTGGMGSFTTSDYLAPFHYQSAELGMGELPYNQYQ